MSQARQNQSSLERREAGLEGTDGPVEGETTVSVLKNGHKTSKCI